MSFFGKFKGGTAQSPANSAQSKKDSNAPQLTLLEKHLGDVSGPARADGSDKFFGFENYGSTCYCNSIMQCLYYSPHFRNYVINFPSQDSIANLRKTRSHAGEPTPTSRTIGSAPYPNPTSPARKTPAAVSPNPVGAVIKVEESKESPEYKKRMAIQNGPVLEMTSDNSYKYLMAESLFTSLREIFESIIQHDSRSGVVSPHRFLEILRRENEMFRSAMHQDAHEFLGLLLNQVVDTLEAFSKQHAEDQSATRGESLAPDSSSAETTLLRTPTRNVPGPSWIRDLFEGSLTSETRCLTCENVSQKDEPFLDLSVDLDAHASVTSCLQRFSEEEMLCEQNKFQCDNCGGLQEAEKRMKIKRLPQILALHLKRFTYTEDLQRLQKLFHRVVYPFYLRLFNTTDDIEDSDRVYELYAVVVHIGSGPYHGHYVSIIKTQDRGWLLFDDELVEPVDRDYVLNFFGGELIPGAQDARQLACAYVLFYQESTVEAMLREEETSGQPATADTAASNPIGLNGKTPDVNKDNLRQVKTTATPLTPDPEVMESLSRAQTENGQINVVTSPRSTFDAYFSSQNPTSGLGKTKKEVKAEEKERKLREKAEAKATEQQFRELSEKRVANFRKQEAELRRVVEESKTTADEEARIRGDAPVPEKTSALSRFRHTSMSLRGKPTKLFSTSSTAPSKEKPLQSDPSISSAILDGDSTSNGDTDATASSFKGMNGRIGTDTDSSLHQDGVPSTNGYGHKIEMPAKNGGEEKKLRHRFSLGRKKSQHIT